MESPLRFGFGLSAISFAIGLVLWILIPWLRGETVVSEDLLATGIVGIVGFLFGYGSAVARNRRIRKLREQYTDESTLLCETTVREYTEFLQFNKHNLVGELFLSKKRLQYIPHADIRPDPTFNSSLEDIQSATVTEIHSKTVLQVVRYEENAYFVVSDPNEWAYRIREAAAVLNAQIKE